jgi:hypothetical protein
MATKYVVELTKAQLFMIIQAMQTHSFYLMDYRHGSEKKCFDRTEMALANKKTKAKYLRENKS